ncbi:polyprenyl synthetase family protein [Streptomyces sp. NPDC059874]|uniref:polyprenyl synthetase family protein n=1 Tax=Streptomyces sp. NPDC059874 TaxID=3346983 RepID=UPI0036502E13
MRYHALPTHGGRRKTAGDTVPLDLPGIRRVVDANLAAFLDDRVRTAVDGRLPAEVPGLLKGFLDSGGKRLRPLLCVIGWHAGGGHGDIAPVLKVAASLELFHAFCLIHDDVMDNSRTRRGQPTVHRALADQHTSDRSRRNAERFGTSGAILIGDLALSWSDELVNTAELTAAQFSHVLPLIHEMRTEVMYGQYLDIAATGSPTDSLDRALAIVRYKTAKYTVERPLHIGAALAGADDSLRAALSDFALPIGEAFQLRDDLLGIYGNPAMTGKPCTDDLRDGKHTAVIAIALQRAERDQRQLLTSLIGKTDLDADGVDHIRSILSITGARHAVEQMIRTRCEQADRALAQAPFPPAARHALRTLARAATGRTG